MSLYELYLLFHWKAMHKRLPILYTLGLQNSSIEHSSLHYIFTRTSKEVTKQSAPKATLLAQHKFLWGPSFILCYLQLIRVFNFLFCALYTGKHAHRNVRFTC